MTDIQKLKALAEAQPIKHWKRTPGRKPDMPGSRLIYGVEGPECVSDYEHWGFTGKAAEFIAAANPAAVLELIAEFDEMKAVFAQPTSLNAAPFLEYHGLKRQFFALRNFALCKDKLAGYYSRELEGLRKVDRSQVTEEIDAERSVNEQLTNDLLTAEAERDQLKAENDALRTALKTIREESHDLGECECAADALIDSRQEPKP